MLDSFCFARSKAIRLVADCTQSSIIFIQILHTNCQVYIFTLHSNYITLTSTNSTLSNEFCPWFCLMTDQTVTYQSELLGLLHVHYMQYHLVNEQSQLVECWHSTPSNIILVLATWIWSGVSKILTDSDSCPYRFSYIIKAKKGKSSMTPLPLNNVICNSYAWDAFITDVYTKNKSEHAFSSLINEE